MERNKRIEVAIKSETPAIIEGGLTGVPSEVSGQSFRLTGEHNNLDALKHYLGEAKLPVILVNGEPIDDACLNFLRTEYHEQMYLVVTEGQATEQMRRLSPLVIH